jgi:hypothetical protein
MYSKAPFTYTTSGTSPILNYDNVNKVETDSANTTISSEKNWAVEQPQYIFGFHFCFKNCELWMQDVLFDNVYSSPRVGHVGRLAM